MFLLDLLRFHTHARAHAHTRTHTHAHTHSGKCGHSYTGFLPCFLFQLSDLSAVSPGTKHGDLEFKDRISGYGLMPSDTSAVNVAVITGIGDLL